MRTALAVAAVATSVLACEGKYPPDYYNRLDAGADAGDAGQADAGDGGDAGCAPLSLNGTGMIDGCMSSTGFNTTGSVSVNTGSCTADINVGTGTVCTGAVSGAGDAFDGGCSTAAGPCHSSSLPGTIICTTGPSTSCTIVVCDGGC